MADLQYIKLSVDQVQDRLGNLSGWSVVEDKLTKTFTFDQYLAGVTFATSVAYAAEKLNHHPDLAIGYGKVTVSVNTHDVGGLSPYDFELARRIDALS